MLNIKPLVLFSAVLAAVWLMPASHAGAQADYGTCVDNGITVNAIEPYYDSNADKTTYMYEITKSAFAPDTLNMFIPRNLVDNNSTIVGACESGGTCSFNIQCDLPCDETANGDCYGKGLAFNCLATWNNVQWTGSPLTLSLEVPGRHGTNPTEFRALAGSCGFGCQGVGYSECRSYGDDDDDDCTCVGGGGFTSVQQTWDCPFVSYCAIEGPATLCEPAKYATNPRIDIDDVGQVRVEISRDGRGCGFDLRRCELPDPNNPNNCLGDWVTVLPETYDPQIGTGDGFIPVIKCSNTRNIRGIDVCEECSITTQINPGWITYIFYGRPYKVCAGVLQGDLCCDLDTGKCCPKTATSINQCSDYIP